MEVAAMKILVACVTAAGFGIGIAAVGNSIETQGGVFVEPHRVAVSEDDLHPRLTGGVDAVSADQRHIDDRLEAVFLTHRLQPDDDFVTDDNDFFIFREY